MDVEVDLSRCQGHTICAMRAPDIFDLSDDDGHALVRVPHPEGEQEQRAIDAAASCPEQAISVVQSGPT